MGSKWTVTPGEVDRYDLSFRGEPFWIELKRELSTGERNRIRTSAIKSYSRRPGDGPDSFTAEEAQMDVNVNMDAALFEKVRTWLADWSLTDDKDNKLPRTIETFKATRGGLFDVIEKAVDDHAKHVEDEEKKASETSEANAVSGPRRISSS